jgi:hypothetical protein
MFNTFNTFNTFAIFAIFEPFIQMLSTVTRKKCLAEARSISATRAIVHGHRDSATCSSPAGSE